MIIFHLYGVFLSSLHFSIWNKNSLWERAHSNSHSMPQVLETVLILIHQCLLFKLSRLDFTNRFAVYWVYGRGELCTLNSYCSPSHRAQTEDSTYTHLLLREPKKRPISWFRIRLSTNFERISKLMTFHPAMAKNRESISRIRFLLLYDKILWEYPITLLYFNLDLNFTPLLEWFLNTSSSWTHAQPLHFLSASAWVPVTLKLCTVVLWGSGNWGT